MGIIICKTGEQNFAIGMNELGGNPQQGHLTILRVSPGPDSRYAATASLRALRFSARKIPIPSPISTSVSPTTFTTASALLG